MIAKWICKYTLMNFYEQNLSHFDTQQLNEFYLNVQRPQMQ